MNTDSNNNLQKLIQINQQRIIQLQNGTYQFPMELRAQEIAKRQERIKKLKQLI